jgi:hypothetical protein
MPSLGDYNCRQRRRTWATMGRSERKAWHRQQQSREIRGLPPLRKP